jgi:two-component system, OmpR family, phosphate regulon sensor histidine kinase PhoR
MSSPWPYLIRRLLLTCLVAIVIAAIFGSLLGLLTLSLLISAQFAGHLVQLWRLTRWLIKPNPSTVPQASGPWGMVFITLFRLQRRAEHGSELLREALSRFQDAGAALPDGLVIMDAYDRIEWCNPLAEAHLGIDLEKDRGQQLTYLMRQPTFLEWLNKEAYEQPLILRNARGSGTSLLFTLVRYGSREKLVVSRDITLIENAERIRRDFVANVSHELRTPITVISGFLETLEDAEELEQESLMHAIGLMRSQAERMQHLVEELLSLSRLESDVGDPIRDEVSVREFIELLTRETTQLSRGRHQIKVEIEGDDILLGSRTELHSAFGNLASNAVRYTPEKGMITLKWQRTEQGGAFSVKDSGIGIAPEHIPRLTERFYRVDKSRSRDTGGTGLGLSIVQHVLTRHQGYLDIQSTPGLGSEFFAHLPSDRVVSALKVEGAESSAEISAAPAIETLE